MPKDISNILVITMIIYLALAMALTGYAVYARKKNQPLKLPVGLFICYFLVMAAIIVVRMMGLESVLNVLEVTALVFMTLAVIRFVIFILIDYLLIYKDIYPIPVITRDIGLVVVYAVVVMIVLSYKANVNPASLLTTSAVLTAVIGLALQDTLGNLVSGIVLQMEKPYRIGDWVKFDNYTGRVVGMSWKSTRVITREKEMVTIPNNLIAKGHIMNYSEPDPVHVATLDVGCSYNDPPNTVRSAIVDTLSEHPRVHRIPAPEIRVKKYSDFSINYHIRFFISDFENEEKVKAHILNQLWYRFKRNGITIPYPIRTIQQVQPDKEREAKEKDLVAERAEVNLQHVDIFSPLAGDDIKRLAQRGSFFRFGEGETIIRQGDPGQSMYAIVSGQADVVFNDGGKELVVATLGPKQFFGEMSLLTGEPRTATVRAKSDLITVKIDKGDLEQILKSNPQVATSISDILAARQEDLAAKKEDFQKEPSMHGKRSASQILNKIKKFFSLDLP